MKTQKIKLTEEQKMFLKSFNCLSNIKTRIYHIPFYFKCDKDEEYFEILNIDNILETELNNE